MKLLRRKKLGRPDAESEIEEESEDNNEEEKNKK